MLVSRGRFEEHHTHEDLHHVGMLEREAGRLTEALEILEREAGVTPPSRPSTRRPAVGKAATKA